MLASYSALQRVKIHVVHHQCYLHFLYSIDYAMSMDHSIGFNDGLRHCRAWILNSPE